MPKMKRGRGLGAALVLLAVGTLLSACEDAEEIEIVGPMLDEVIATAQASSGADDGLRISGTSLGIGRDEPLIYIDGVRANGTGNGPPEAGDDGLPDLDPDDIEKITVLKGAKAKALYGPEAWRGVILITLKDSISE